jgi:TIR domain
MAEVFISHADEEKALAGAVERLIRDVFAPDGPSVFLSSNLFTLVGGELFEERIRKEIQGCTGFVAMCSNKSFERHWLHLEKGAAWGMGKPVIPVCYGGKAKGSLPRPYSSFHAVDLVDPYALVVAIGTLTGRAIPPPPGLYLSGRKFEQGILHTGPYEPLLAELYRHYPVATK